MKPDRILPALRAELQQRLITPTLRQRRAYNFESDGFATSHYSPFRTDSAFNESYRQLRQEWFPDADVDVRWRLWVLVQAAGQSAQIDGSFAEFGVYRAGCAFMIFRTFPSVAQKRYFLFDTFAGIPTDRLTDREVDADLAGAHADTSVEYVRRRLSPLSDNLEFVEGDVNETLQGMDTGPLAFVHMDLNASQPTQLALEYAYPRLQPGGMIVFDDYGQKGLEAQRAVIDGFAGPLRERIMALPTGQALLTKL